MKQNLSVEIYPVESDNNGDTRYRWYARVWEGKSCIWDDWYIQEPTEEEVLESIEDLLGRRDMGEMSQLHAEITESLQRAYNDWEIEKMFAEMSIDELLEAARKLDAEVKKREEQLDEDNTDTL